MTLMDTTKQQTVAELEHTNENQHNEYIEVKTSGIHRHGVFAITDIPKDTKIMTYRGIKITKEESDILLKNTIERHKRDPTNHAGTYIFELDENFDLDGDIPNNDAKFINHSCEPNCEVDVVGEEVLIYTTRDIKQSEEITYNYGFEIDEKDIYDFKTHPCKCGSKRCAGYILAEEEWPKMKELLEKEDMLLKKDKS